METTCAKVMKTITCYVAVLLALTSCWSQGDTQETASASGNDHSAIDIWCGPNSEALVVDSDGHRTGLDVSSGKTYQEIPNSSYVRRYHETPSGASAPAVRELYVSAPANGDYRLTVAATRDSADGPFPSAGASIECYYSDITLETARKDFRGLRLSSDEVHNFLIHFDKRPEVHSCITGGFAGGGENAEIDQFLSYVNITKAKTKLPPGTDSTNLFVIYGDAILAESFKAVLNQQDISSLFTPVAGGHDVVRLPVTAGKNALTLSVRGSATEKETVDIDKLEFKVE